MFLDEEFKDFLQLLDNIFIINDYTINSFEKLKIHTKCIEHPDIINILNMIKPLDTNSFEINVSMLIDIVEKILTK